MALLALGSFVLFDSVTKLLMFEHPPIGLVKPFGDRPIWLGWPMLAALAWSALPAVLLGRAKQPLARELHDKVLVADAEMNRADWLTAGAAMLGVIGIVAIADLMDKEPTVVDHSRLDPLPLWVRNELMLLDWVKDAEVRLREEGHVYFGEAFVVPVDDQDLVERLQRANQHLLDRDWRLHELVITPVSEIQRPRAGRRRALSHGLATDPSLVVAVGVRTDPPFSAAAPRPRSRSRSADSGGRGLLR